jgi:hypothetical protein
MIFIGLAFVRLIVYSIILVACLFAPHAKDFIGAVSYRIHKNFNNVN